MKAWLAAALIAAPLYACDDDGGDDASPDMEITGGAGGEIGGAGGGMGGAGGAGGELGGAGGGRGPVAPPPADCDALDPEICTLPWPSNLYLVEDDTRGSGYSLSFGEESLPSNRLGTRIRPDAFQRMDGYPLSSQILVRLPGADLDLMARQGNIEDSLAEDAPIVLYEVSGEGLIRQPYFIEPDARAPEGADPLIFIRPAIHLREDTRYIVALRDIVDLEGAPLPRSAAFDALLSGNLGEDATLQARKPRFDEIFGLLEGAGLDTGALHLAWDFHTASTDGLHSYMLHIRDDAFSRVGEAGPALVVDNVERFMTVDSGAGRAGDVMEVVRVEGHFDAPNYLKLAVDENGVEGYTLNLGPDGMPQADGTRQAKFWLVIPAEAFEGEPHNLVQYGHGLFGSGEETLYPGWVRLCGRLEDRPCGWFNMRPARDHQLIYFGADLTGMAEEDLDVRALALLADLNKFVWIPDRLHQGLMEWLILTRAMKAQFQDLEGVAGQGVTLNDEIYYSGNSQGGIFGGAFAALSPEITRAHLGVPGVGYNRFLERSTGFSQFFVALENFYPERLDQAVLLELLQILWDGTENSGYMWRLSHSPFEGQDPTHVLAAPAKGDYLVPPISYEMVGRTCDLGVGVMVPYDVDRTPALACEQTYPHAGSGVVVWDLGNPWPEPGNVTPPEHPLGDPHEDARQIDALQDQMAEFFRTGQIVDVCEGGPCQYYPQETK